MGREKVYVEEKVVAEWRKELTSAHKFDLWSFCLIAVAVGVLWIYGMWRQTFDVPIGLTFASMIGQMLLSAGRWSRVRNKLSKLMPYDLQRKCIDPLSIYVPGIKAAHASQKNFVLVAYKPNQATF